jgi:hypothetical protein
MSFPHFLSRPFFRRSVLKNVGHNPSSNWLSESSRGGIKTQFVTSPNKSSQKMSNHQHSSLRFNISDIIPSDCFFDPNRWALLRWSKIIIILFLEKLSEEYLWWMMKKFLYEKEKVSIFYWDENGKKRTFKCHVKSLRNLLIDFYKFRLNSD